MDSAYDPTVVYVCYCLNGGGDAHVHLPEGIAYAAAREKAAARLVAYVEDRKKAAAHPHHESPKAVGPLGTCANQVDWAPHAKTPECVDWLQLPEVENVNDVGHT